MIDMYTIEVKKAMYGLKQAGLLAQQLLEKRLKEACSWIMDP